MEHTRKKIMARIDHTGSDSVNARDNSECWCKKAVFDHHGKACAVS
jgi:hypothetical protein